MKRVVSAILTLAACYNCLADVTVSYGRNSNEHAAPDFRFEKGESPVRNDAAESGAWTILSGRADRNSGRLAVLGDGRLPSEDDQPRANFFFAQATARGRLLLDLGHGVELARVSSFSWHPGSRSPQVYRLYVAGPDFSTNAALPEMEADPAKLGWKLAGQVDSREQSKESGGQVAAHLLFEPGVSCRYLLFDVSATDPADPFGQTFFSEIDVVDAKSANALTKIASQPAGEVFTTRDGKFQFVLEASDTPDLQEWAREKVIPMAREWYPKLVAMLPSEGFQAPARVRIVIDPHMSGVADTSGARVRCAAGWFRANLEGEALGAVFHEFVHVVQQYGRARNPNRVPGWFTEGMADYIRWFIFEPQTKGAEIRGSRVATARYDASYRVSANFLNWATLTCNKDLVPRLNAAIREGRYSADLWKELSGRTVEELGSEWKEALQGGGR